MKRKLLTALLTVCLCAAVFAAAALAGGPISGVSDEEWDVLKIVNRNRIENGRDCLSLFGAIQDATDTRSHELMEVFDHTRPDGTSCFTALKELGIPFDTAGENIAAGQWSAEFVMECWMDSPGHRANILDEKFTHIGIGYVKDSASEFTHYWTQLFVSDWYEGATSLSLSKSSVTAKVGTKLTDMGITITEVNTDYGKCYLPLIDEMCPVYDRTAAGEQVLTIEHMGLSVTLTVTLTQGATEPPTAKPTASPTAPPSIDPTDPPEPGRDPEVGDKISRGGLKYVVTAPGEVCFTGVDKSVSKVTVPDTVSANGRELAVTGIADNAFLKDKKLKTVTIGANVETIGASAFKGCAKLTTVKGGESVTEIESNAFNGCKMLKKFPVMDGLETIGAGAFKGCVKLAKFTLGENVSDIGKNAFNGCKALKTITVKTEWLDSDSVGKAAFKGISKKTTFKCPKSMLKAYKKLFVKKGAPKSCRFR